jgi:hopanoid biosynthesis associated radical SAM protein HpnH
LSIPFLQKLHVGGYLIRQQLAGRKRYPLVLMLEPLFRCNLACAGCGKIDYPDDILNQRISVADALQAVDECGAPVVSICGGEPMIYPGIGELTAKILERKKVVYLCTNGMFIRKKIK